MIELNFLCEHLSPIVLEDRADIRFMRGATTTGFRAGATYDQLFVPPRRNEMAATQLEKLCPEKGPNLLLDPAHWEHQDPGLLA